MKVPHYVEVSGGEAVVCRARWGGWGGLWEGVGTSGGLRIGEGGRRGEGVVVTWKSTVIRGWKRQVRTAMI